MAEFCVSHNNGYTAVIRADDTRRFAEIKAAGGNPLKVVKIFVFCSDGLIKREPAIRRVVCGSAGFLDRLLAGRHNIVKNPGGWDGNVPFSNGDYDNIDAVVTPEDVAEAFELLPA